MHNLSDTEQDVQLDMVYKLVLGLSEEQTARYLYSQWDNESNSLKVRNVYHPIYHDKTLYLSATEPLTDVSFDYPNRKRIGLSLSIPANSDKEIAFIIAVGDKPDFKIHNISIDTINKE